MHENGVHDVKSYYLKSNNFNTEEQPAIVPEKGSKDSLADGQPDGFYVTELGIVIKNQKIQKRISNTSLKNDQRVASKPMSLL